MFAYLPFCSRKGYVFLSLDLEISHIICLGQWNFSKVTPEEMWSSLHCCLSSCASAIITRKALMNNTTTLPPDHVHDEYIRRRPEQQGQPEAEHPCRVGPKSVKPIPPADIWVREKDCSLSHWFWGWFILICDLHLPECKIQPGTSPKVLLNSWGEKFKHTSDSWFYATR